MEPLPYETEIGEKEETAAGIKPIRGGVNEYEEKDSFLKRVLFDDKLLKTHVEGIIHMGACSDTTEQDASFLVENNYKYTQVLAKWCVKNGKRFLYASTAATYGNGENGFEDDEEKIEDLKPLNK